MIKYNLIEIVKKYAYEKHNEINQKYDGKPYAESHLEMVVVFAYKYINLIPKDKQALVICGCWLHDFEDITSVTYNDLKKLFGEELAELSYALWNEKGRTRPERANEKYYKGIRDTPFAVYVKLCDRFANLTYSINSNSSMAQVYKKENNHFMESIFKSEYIEMFYDLNELLKKV